MPARKGRKPAKSAFAKRLAKAVALKEERKRISGGKPTPVQAAEAAKKAGATRAGADKITNSNPIARTLSGRPHPAAVPEKEVGRAIPEGISKKIRDRVVPRGVEAYKAALAAGKKPREALAAAESVVKRAIRGAKWLRAGTVVTAGLAIAAALNFLHDQTIGERRRNKADEAESQFVAEDMVEGPVGELAEQEGLSRRMTQAEGIQTGINIAGEFDQAGREAEVTRLVQGAEGAIAASGERRQILLSQLMEALS